MWQRISPQNGEGLASEFNSNSNRSEPTQPAACYEAVILVYPFSFLSSTKTSLTKMISSRFTEQLERCVFLQSKLCFFCSI